MGAARAARLPGPPQPLPGRPDAVVDLRTAEGAALVGARWHWTPARVHDTDFVEVGTDLGPTGPPNRTQDIVPHLDGIDPADGVDLEPADLELRLGTGRVSFGWYRTAVTLPGRLGDLDVTGTTVVFEIVVDDYAEVWVDGVLAPALGARGGGVVAGFNAPNRVVLTRAARAGQTFHLAVFAINGPVSVAPANYIWVRTATLDVYAAESARPGEPVWTELAGATAGAERVVAGPLVAERVADGFDGAEGPVWTDGALLFSSPGDNTVYRWSPAGTVDVARAKSGYAGVDIGRLPRPGPCGLAVDPGGRLVLCQLGERRVVRIEPRGNLTVLADRYEGRRLNSPHHVAVRSDGTVFFTDPPFGLPRGDADPKRELPYSGVYALAPDGAVRLVGTELAGPVGLAFSPGERFLYVANREPDRAVVLRYALDADGTPAGCEVFADLSDLDPGPYGETLGGLVVDGRGTVYVCGPGGVHLLAPDGRRLGRIRLPAGVRDLAWGDDDGRALYVTDSTSVYRVRGFA